MSLYEKIDQDIKQAMILRQAERLGTLRFLKSALKYSAIEKKVDALSDSDVQQIIQKQIKQRKEAIEQFAKGDRKELVEKETREAAILESYLPAQLSDEALEGKIQELLIGAALTSKKEFGKAMKLIQERLLGQAEAKRISEILSKKLR